MVLKGLTSALDAALAMVARGFCVIPIPRGEKAPRGINGWQHLRLGASDIPDWFQLDQNLGVQTGEPSRDCVDIDLDAAETVAVAPDLLPATQMIHGRTGKPRSHWWYLSTPCASTAKFKDPDGTMLVELRSTGLQTIVPPSTHPNGEVLVWEADGDPATVSAVELQQCVAAVAASALIARHWPQPGSRQEAALALSGFLLRCNYATGKAKAFIGAAARAAGDPEWQKRADAVDGTAAKLAANSPITGAPTLEQLLTDGTAVMKCARKWLKANSKAELSDDPLLPSLDAADLNLPVITGQALAALERANRPRRFFLYGEQLIRTSRRTDGSLGLQPLYSDELRYELVRCARWFKMSGSGEARRALPPQHVVRDLLVTPTLPFPALRRVIHVPCVARDGRLITTPGFDEPNGLLYDPPPGLTIPEIHQAPTSTDMEQAIDLLLRDLLVDFPFTSDGDRAAIVACILLPFVRDLIEGPTPLHLIEKPQPGTGATLLVNVIGAIAGSDAVMQITGASDNDEWRKRLTSALLAGPQILVIDNVHGMLDNDALASAITATLWRDRRLGENRIATAPVSCTWIATGNNPRLSHEMARRAVRIRLDARTDQPWQRTGFKHANLPAYVRDHRGEIVAALLTIVTAWQRAGRPRGPESLGMFEEWAAVLGGILNVAGLPGFLESQTSIYESADVETGAWRAFVERWWDAHGEDVVGVKELWPLVDDPDPIDLGLGRGDERALKTTLGRRLQQLRDRQFGSLRIVPVKKRQRAQLWRLERTGSASPSPGSSAGPASAAQPAPSTPTDSLIDSGPPAHGEPSEPPKPPADHQQHGPTAGADPKPGNGADSPPQTVQDPAAMSRQPFEAPPLSILADGTSAPASCLAPAEQGPDVVQTGDPGADPPPNITRGMQRDLLGLGYPQPSIDRMPVAEAVEILDAQRHCDLGYIIPAFNDLVR